MPAESYHCICGTLLLVLPGYANLEGLPRRKAKDLEQTPVLVIKSNIIPQPVVLNSARDKKALIVKRPDGYEKRWLWKCTRCKVPWAYELNSEGREQDSTEGRAMCLLADGLTSTPELEKMINDTKLPDVA